MLLSGLNRLPDLLSELGFLHVAAVGLGNTAWLSLVTSVFPTFFPCLQYVWIGLRAYLFSTFVVIMAHAHPPVKEISCRHLTTDSVFRKGQVRNFKGQRVPLASPCPICNVIHRLWKDYAEGNRIFIVPKATSIHQHHGQQQAASARDLTPGQRLSEKQLVLEYRPSKDDHAFTVRLEPKQVGEAYHVLICHILLEASRGKGINLYYAPPSAKDEKEREAERQSTVEIRRLFHWYQKSDETKIADTVSKDMATDVIVAAFRASNSHRRMEEFYSPTQFRLFARLLNYLDTCMLQHSHPQLSQRADLNEKYFRPSYAAKYLLNRYFDATNQPRLPKNAAVKRMAVIHVRRHAKSLIGFEMDSSRLEYVAQSIARVNQVANALKQLPISHVVLYGDFDDREGADLKKNFEEYILSEERKMLAARKSIMKLALRAVVARLTKKEKMKHMKVEVSYLSSPWKSPSDNFKNTAKVEEVWSQFRKNDFDHLPILVKTLALWMALCRRYRPKLCVIGFRSGFIEAAALIGIPIFYLNIKEDGAKDHVPGQILWKSFKPRELSNRRRKLSDVMNTFIPIECLGAKDDKGIYKVKDKYKFELPAALFMYMCCKWSLKMTSEEIELWHSSGENYVQDPGWTMRVDMMHNKCKGDKKGVSRKGRKLLQNRYHFAELFLRLHDSSTTLPRKSLFMLFFDFEAGSGFK